MELLVISILDDHSFHDLEGSLHRDRVKRILNGGNSLLNRFLILPVLLLFFELSSLDLFISVHVGIEDLPLSGLQREVSLDGRVSFDTSLLKREVKGLTRALLVVELISEGLLLGALISIQGIFAELLLDSDVNLVK